MVTKTIDAPPPTHPSMVVDPPLAPVRPSRLSAAIFSFSAFSFPTWRFLILSWSIPMIFIQAFPPPLPIAPYMVAEMGERRRRRRWSWGAAMFTE